MYAVKVLDFGLAKALDTRAGGAGAAGRAGGHDLTLTSPAMTAGIVLGTAPYMSPEQAKGRPVDRRADIWAFGAVLFEMLAGTRAFPGEDITDTIVAVMWPWNAKSAHRSGEVVQVLAISGRGSMQARRRTRQMTWTPERAAYLR